MRTIVVALALVAASSLPLAGQRSPASRLMRVYITSSAIEADRASGFAPSSVRAKDWEKMPDGPERQFGYLSQSAIPRLAKAKNAVVAIVTERAAADLVFEFTGTEKTLASGLTLSSVAGPKNEYTARAVLIMGDRRKEISGTTVGSLDATLKALVSEFNTFARDNQALLTADK